MRTTYGHRVFFGVISVVSLACSSSDDGGSPAADGFSAEEQRLQSEVTAERIAPHIQYLADDALEGRGPGSPGGLLAMQYIADEFRKVGLQPGGEQGTFLQDVPLVAIKAEVPTPVVFSSQRDPQKKESLEVPNELVVVSGVHEPEVKITAAELVFVGYGIVAPEYQWDDYKDVDVTGKIVVVMNNDPSDDPALFAGSTRLWYGRWDYKYLQAAKKGAKGAIIIHTTPSAGYPWQVVVTSNAREKYELPPSGQPRTSAKMWATEEASKRIAALSGEDLDALRSAAEKRDFRPRPLGVTMDLTFTNTVRNMKTGNVIGVLPGSDPELAKEAVIYTAHHDHLGLGAPRNGDAIYNGAVDNASGVAQILAVARAAALSEPKPRRSVLFMSVGAEEQGLLGSEWYSEHPTFAPGRIAANLNTDSANVLGETRDVGFVGLGKSSLDDVVTAVAKAQGRTVHGDAFPDRGSYYRSDQFSFAKVGIPGIYIKGGPDFVGRPAGWGAEQTVLFESTKYHQPSDEYDPNWDLSGAVQDARLLLLAGLRIANTPALPAWKPGDEFASIPRPR
ncbi:M28 family peptidase [Pendulispora rubella]|uniref:M28 family peptidase n=1 Tax=Pendulispora rubella TaxID=2741070 RepID=A0ABZ2L7M2_9BACT